MTKLIIPISGYKRVGKDTCANILADKFREGGLTVAIESFASPMKRIIATTFGISLDDLERYKNDPANFTISMDAPVITDFRSILQRFGVEAMRPEFGSSVWADLMVNRIRASSADVVIIPDHRFDTELTTLLATYNNVNTLHVHSDLSSSTDNHSSEQLPTARPDRIVDNTPKDSSINDELSSYVYEMRAKYGLQ